MCIRDRDYTNLINQYVWDKSQRLEVFERGGMYLATKKIGKNNPKATEIGKFQPGDGSCSALARRGRVQAIRTLLGASAGD